MLQRVLACGGVWQCPLQPFNASAGNGRICTSSGDEIGQPVETTLPDGMGKAGGEGVSSSLFWRNKLYCQFIKKQVAHSAWQPKFAHDKQMVCLNACQSPTSAHAFVKKLAANIPYTCQTKCCDVFWPVMVSEFLVLFSAMPARGIPGTNSPESPTNTYPYAEAMCKNMPQKGWIKYVQNCRKNLFIQVCPPQKFPGKCNATDIFSA
mmetsp:Transcript_62254/g.103312  ORF Transcript_62254/g.103312 Transcript_62254/m.103312 type:complete len:207 (-) Transcript_62254:661-1281(-)